jgi:hypothetical protein
MFCGSCVVVFISRCGRNGAADEAMLVPFLCVAAYAVFAAGNEKLNSEQNVQECDATKVESSY